MTLKDLYREQLIEYLDDIGSREEDNLSEKTIHELEDLFIEKVANDECRLLEYLERYQ